MTCTDTIVFVYSCRYILSINRQKAFKNRNSQSRSFIRDITLNTQSLEHSIVILMLNEKFKKISLYLSEAKL